MSMSNHSYKSKNPSQVSMALIYSLIHLKGKKSSLQNTHRWCKNDEDNIWRNFLIQVLSIKEDTIQSKITDFDMERSKVKGWPGGFIFSPKVGCSGFQSCKV